MNINNKRSEKTNNKKKGNRDGNRERKDCLVLLNPGNKQKLKTAERRSVMKVLKLPNFKNGLVEEHNN